MDHHLEPDHYHLTFGSHAPALTVSPGDRVATTTVDAFGQDASGERVTPGGNPQTGPIAVAGVAPGDTLVVRLDRVEPSRGSGFTSSAIAPSLVDPDYVGKLPQRALVEWAVDRDARTATLELPGSMPSHIEVPLAPMLGCIGVAPDRGQAISTATSGRHGGNMDYRGVVAGVTLYFPVFVDGALLHVGDGHATQGDGEVVGTGIEISMDVELTIDVRRGQEIRWPRGESDGYIFTFGNARPLDQALQHATTEMLRWLTSEHGMTADAANHLLGQCVEYDVGNVFDPAYTVVCKLAKSMLR